MNNRTRHDIDELESEEDVGELANQCRLLRARIKELEAERGAWLKMGQRLVEAADQWLAAEENKRPESTLRENAYQFTSVAMELADVYRQALARSTDMEDVSDDT